MTKRAYLLCSLTLLFAVTAFAAIPDLKFRRLGTGEGVSSSQVNSILRDRNGYVWLGTSYGLNRYDGYRVRTFFSYEKDTTTLRNNRIDEIQEGHTGELWLKQGMNYSVFFSETESVERHPMRWLAQYGVAGGLEYIHIDSKKNYWVKTYDDGLYYLNPSTKRLTHINFGNGPHDFPKEFGISACAESKEGMVLVSTYGELLCINGESGQVLWKEDYVKRALDAYNDYWVSIDREENIWVITHSTSLYVYAKKEGTRRWQR